MSENVKPAHTIYEAFGRGDIPTILDQMADDVAWESWDDNSAQRAGVPWPNGNHYRDQELSRSGTRRRRSCRRCTRSRS